MRQLAIVAALSLVTCATPAPVPHVFGYTPIPAGSSGGGSNAWAAAQLAAQNKLVSSFNTSAYLKPGQFGSASGACVLGNTAEGGSLGVASDTVACNFTNAVWQNPKTGPWAVSFQAKFPAIATGTSWVGVANGNTAEAVFGWSQATSATNWSYYLGSAFAATSTAADANWHDVLMANDGTTFTVQLDGNTIQTSTTLTSIGTSAGAPSSFTSLALTPGVLVSQVFYQWVNPITMEWDLSQPLNAQFDGIGTNAMMFSRQAESASNGATATTIAIEEQRIVDSGYKMARTWTGLDWVCPGFPTTTGCPDFTQAHWTAFEAELNAMKAGNVPVYITVPWTWTTELCNIPSTSPSGCTPTTSNENAVASLASSMLNRLINTDGFSNIAGLFITTEPNDTTPPLASGFTTGQQYLAHVATVIANQIVSDDGSRTPIRPKIKIVGPQENDATVYLSYQQANTSGVFDRFSEHSYCFSPLFAPFSYSQNHCPATAGWTTMFADTVTLTGTSVGIAGSTPFWNDEINELGPSGGNDPDRYRWTGDDGLLLGAEHMAHVQAKAAGSLAWMMQDQFWVTTSQLAEFQQQYGIAPWPGASVAPYPAWFEESMLANLTPGGQGNGGLWSKSYRVYSQTSQVRGTGFSAPPGSKGCTDAAGCYTFVITNQGSQPQKIGWSVNSALNRAFYRYTFTAENTPHPGSNKAAYRIPYDMSASVGNSFPATVIPGHSVVAFSTINLSAPVATSLSGLAVASASSGLNVANVGDLNTSHVTGAFNSWTTASGSGWVQLTWPSAQTINHVDIDSVGTEEPNFYGTYADTTHPSPLTAYTLQYLLPDLVTWTTLATVSSNTQFHRTHTFGAVSTTAIRVNVNDSSSPVNEISAFNDPANIDTALGYYTYTDATATAGTQDTQQIATTSYTFQSGDTIEYDVEILDNKAGLGGIDVTVGAGCAGAFSTLGSAWQDQNAVQGSPASDLSPYAYAAYFHRILAVPACAVGQTSTSWMIASNRADRICTSRNSPCTAGTYWGAPGTAFYDNIVVKHAGGAIAVTIYSDGAPATVTTSSTSHMLNGDVWVQPKLLS